MRAFHHFPLITVLLGIVLGGLFWLAGPAPQHWVYDRELVIQGEVWRLISGHLVHSDLKHLFWNLTGALILGGLLEARLGYKMLSLSLSGLFCINLFLLYEPALAQYCGLSGLLNTWLAAVLVLQLKNSALRPYVIVTTAAAIIKIMLEMKTGEAVFTDTAWRSIPEAHLWGLIGGIVWWLFYRFISVNSTSKNFFNLKNLSCK